MNKTVWTYGLVSGALYVLLMSVSVGAIREHRMTLSDTIGYSSMLAAALLTFFGIRSYRQNAGQGRLTFLQGLKVGTLITLVSCTCYALAFQIYYFFVSPDFGDVFQACMVKRAELAGSSLEEIAKTAKQAAAIKGLYDHPLTNAAVTFGITMPVGLAASAIAALILRRR
jgi:hypothetical protein